jgi:hypothetical protein
MKTNDEQDCVQNVLIGYEKIYKDDLGTHLATIFTNKDIVNIGIDKYWTNAVDGFYKGDCIHHIMCIQGDIRLVIAKDQGNNTYKFNQFFISGLDGKILTIQPNIWFAVHNLSEHVSIIMTGVDKTVDYEQLNYRIFTWNTKRP